MGADFVRGRGHVAQVPLEFFVDSLPPHKLSSVARGAGGLKSNMEICESWSFSPLIEVSCELKRVGIYAGHRQEVERIRVV